ncbi:MAG: glutamate--tRNA ligase family protein [Halobacteriovoraceae bacterium]|nr:glutamate--tRNA ligase family protein [Halobacteriovoraceae bacterium]
MNRKFRIAPTPSGFLHSGNALNFVLTWALAKRAGAKLWLRIDDSDQTRVRDEYLENVFETLEWLGLDWDEGPYGLEDFKKNHSQSLKTEYYFSELQKVEGLFPCECSRSQLKNELSYPKTCYKKNLDFKRGTNALRVLTNDSWDISPEFFHSILWRKDDLPAYQWVSLIEDRDHNVTDIVRGIDLFESTRFQSSLAKRCQVEFGKNFIHHRLLEHDGKKISKSQKAPSLLENFKTKDLFFREVVSTYLNLRSPISSPEEILKLDQIGL